MVVSASLDLYLSFWCDEYHLELICSRLDVRNRRIQGRFEGGDCSGREKANRIKKRYAIEDYALVYAYGDSADDREMLALADIRFYRWRRLDWEDPDK